MSLALTGKQIRDAQAQPYLRAGQSADMILEMTNYASPITNLKVTLASTSPNITITNPTIFFGPAGSNATVSNSGNPFKLQVNSGIPANTPVLFRVTSTDGIYTKVNYFTQFVNPDYIDINTNQLTVTVSGTGRLGYGKEFSLYDYGVGTQYQLTGNGIRYKNQPLLYEAGILIGSSDDKVSSTIRSNKAQFTKDNDFVAVNPIGVQSYALTDQIAGGRLSESKNGLEVSYQAYAWKNAPLDKFVIVEYQLKNTSGADIDSVYAGLFADWEINGRKDNRLSWDASNRLGYAFNSTGSSMYAGIQLLTNQPVNYYAFDNQAGINIFDGFTSAEKFAGLSKGTTRTQSVAGADDVAQMLAAQIKNLKQNQVAVVAFAILAGDDLHDLQRSALAAKQKFIEINRSPAPILATPNICRGDMATLNPANGGQFKLYTTSSSLTPAATGTTFSVGPFTKDSTFYITGTDSLFESTPVAVKADVFEANFKLSSDTLGIYEAHILTATDQSDAATQWQWDFGDGTGSTQQHPNHQYTQPGTYQITLLARNAQGCTASHEKTVWVFNGIYSLTPTVSEVVVCPGSSLKIQPGNGNSFKLYTQLPAHTPVASGSDFEAGPALKDTVYYVTGNDFLFESEPVAVAIKVARHQTDFRVMDDSLDLRDEEILHLNDQSKEAVSWHWNFGDGTTSREPNPTHQYTNIGTYTVTLRTENGYGCADSLSKNITVTRTLVEDLAQAITLYPNPSSGRVYLEKDHGFITGKITVEVYTPVGKELYKAAFIQPPHVIDLSFVQKESAW